MQSYSFRIETTEKDILYSGDIWSLDDIETHLKKLDLLVVETMHIDISALPALADKHGIGKVLLTHINDADLDRIRAFSRQAGPKRFIVAEDGLSIKL